MSTGRRTRDSSDGGIKVTRAFLESDLSGCRSNLHPCSDEGAAAPRSIEFSFERPIAQALRPGDKHVVMESPVEVPLTGRPENSSWETRIAEANSIILIGRVVEKRPEFMNLQNFRTFTVVRADQATWIGSTITMRVDEVLKNSTKMPLSEGQEISFIDEGDGTVMINGVRVDTRTDWLRPIERGQRYLLTAEVKNRFIVTGMWDEPIGGGRMRGRVLERHDLDNSRDGGQPSEWHINDAVYHLQREIAKQHKSPSRSQ